MSGDYYTDAEVAELCDGLSQPAAMVRYLQVEYLRTTGGGESTFIDTAIGADNLPNGITSITRHTLKG
jgi:hypothetical protein